MKNKGKRWPKHGSSASNPSLRKFRNAAAARKSFKPSGPSGLTVEALQKHDGNANVEEKMQLDMENCDAKTFNTWATNFTNCTNITFSRVLKLWSDSNHDLHKEVIATLAALTEVINEKGGTGTHLEYFAILMTTLESRKTTESATAAALLLSMIVKKVSPSILKARFSDLSKRLTESIIQHGETESTTLIKSLLMTLACVLRAQEAAQWSLSSTKNNFELLLHFTLHKKPRVRKAAQQAVQLVLKGSLFLSQPDSPPYHPAAGPTAQFCVNTIETKGGKSGGAEEVDTLHALNLLQNVIAVFPRKLIEEACTSILRVMTVNRPLVIANGMAALYGLFSQHPAALPAEVNAQIINALHDYQPEENDSGTMPGWLAVMEQAHLNLSRLDVDLCLGHLPRLFSAAMACLLSHHKDIRTSSNKLINFLLRQCIGAETEKLAARMKTLKADGETPMHKIVRALEAGLSYQYHHNWALVFQMLATMMEVLGKICPDLLKKCLRSMADLHDTTDFGFRADVDTAIGKAVRSMGPGHVIEAVPLDIMGNEENPDLSRSWLLPVIRDNVAETELSFFTTFFLPLADRFRQKAQELATRNVVVSKTYESLELQVWSLLKGFCTRPTDLAKSFNKGIARKLGSALTERPELRMEIMSSLRSLVNFSRNDEANKAAMNLFAKNFIPIFLNLFTTNPDNPNDTRRLAILETVKVYFTIASDELLGRFLDTCLSKIREKDNTVSIKIAQMDIATALVNYADESRLNQLYSLAEENIKASDKTLQKKAYRILEHLCAGQSQTCRDFLSSDISRLSQLLLGSLSTNAPSTRNPRLRCLASICQQLEEPNTAFVQAVVPEAILCMKGVGERTRVAANHLILEIAQTMIRWNPDAEEKDVLSGYVKMLYAGLAGSPEMISATLLALCRIVSHFKERLSHSTLSDLIEMVCLLLPRQQREIVKAALDFIRTLVGAYQRDDLCTHLSQIVSGLASVKLQLHYPLKQVFRKLIKKFGHEDVDKLTPAKLSKVVHKVGKELEQERRKKESKSEPQDSDSEEAEPVLKAKPETMDEILQDSDMEEEEEESRAKAKRGGQHKAWIKEEDDDIVDLLDISAAKKVLASKPKAETKMEVKKEADIFKVTPDGRIIITEPKDDQGENMNAIEEEDLDDLLTMIEGGSDKKRRTRLRAQAKNADEDAEPRAKYKAGGSGIHRPLTGDGTEYKAKKASGDIKKTGKPDPYAYVPLNFAQLNKRKQAKLKGQFASIVKGAKKGARKGAGKRTRMS